MRTAVLTLIAGLLLGLTPCAGNEAAWQDFQMPNTDFAVSLPAKPKVLDDMSKKAGTLSLGYVVLQGRMEYHVSYSVTSAFPQWASPDQSLDAVRDGLVLGNESVRERKATLRSERRFTVGESRAMELVLDVPESKTEKAQLFKWRFYVRRDHATQRTVLYETRVVGPAGYDAHPDVARFLDSFHFNEAAWQDFQMPNTDFAVSMPGEPKDLGDSTEKDGTIRRQYVAPQGRMTYFVWYTVAPASKYASPDQFLDVERAAGIRVMKATLRSERRFTFGESRATDLVLDVAESKTEKAHVIKARFYVRRDHASGHAMLYETVVIGPPGYDAHPDVARFLDSFHFVTG